MQVVTRIAATHGTGPEVKVWLRQLLGACMMLMSLIWLVALVSYGFLEGLLNRLEFGGSPLDVHKAVTSSVVYGSLSVVCWVIGVRWLRGRRRLVLFLRRFGFADATGALTDALVGRLGRDWRMLTLDDELVAPVGVHERVVRLALIGRRVAVWSLILLLPCVILVVWIETAHPGSEDTVDPSQMVDLMANLLVIGALVLVAVLIAMIAATLSALFLSHARWVDRAERSKRVVIHNRRALRRVVRRSVRLSRRVFAPRLTVATVSSDLWRAAVSRLLGTAAVVLIDVSDPSENLVWELRALQAQGARWIPIGSVERLRALPQGQSSVETEFLTLLAERQVLGYRMNHLQPFATALNDALSAVQAEPT